MGNTKSSGGWCVRGEGRGKGVSLAPRDATMLVQIDAGADADAAGCLVCVTGGGSWRRGHEAGMRWTWCGMR